MNEARTREVARERLAVLQHEINRREDEIAQLHTQISRKDHSLARIQVSEELNREDNRSKGAMLGVKEREVEELRRELELTRRQLDEVVMTRKAEGTALLEIDHYKADNERLVQMLSKTQEFHNFGKLALDSITDGFSGGIRYLNPDKQPRKCHPRPKSPSGKDFEAEMEEWIPEEAFKVAHDFRNKCASSISQAQLNVLLQELNKIWRNREKKQVQRVQNQTHREIAYLRRQLTGRKPYE